MSDGKPDGATAAKTVERKFTIRNKYGIHARPAALFVKTVNQFQSDVTVTKDGDTVPGRSIMGLLTLEGYPGAVLTITATGPDADAAVAAVGKLIDSKFFED